MELRNFNDLYENVPERTDRNLLVGNGFSQAYNRDIFNYQNLSERANFGGREDVIRQIFRKLDTYDFEAVMSALLHAKDIANVYGQCEELIKSIDADGEKLKEALVNVIAETHPLRPYDVSEKSYTVARPFIANFTKLFSLNYDLLLYWIVNKTEFEPKGYIHFRDGFDGNQWKNWPDQNIFFLHGGMHLYEDAGGVKKHTFDRREGIVDKVQRNLEHGKFPIFVSEPNSSSKLARIKHQEYLLACYNALKNIKGSLFIYGHSIDINDAHIFSQINFSGVDEVNISIYGCPESHSNASSIQNANRMLSNKQVNFYRADSAKIWRK